MMRFQRARRLASRLLVGGRSKSVQHPSGVMFDADAIAHVTDAYFTHSSSPPGTPWDALRDAHMHLPAWFQSGLDPFGAAYAEQQHRLWQLVAGVDRPYLAQVDEKEHDWGDIDPVRTPGFYARRDPGAIASASDHILATGMILKHSRLQAGDRALEYGAGFGQTALALARLGVQVDTVDISSTFCDFVRRQAEFFAVPLQPHLGEFGANPRPGERYKLIWFYESFHHCVNFLELMSQLQENLAEGGQIILAGEPIVENEYAAVPYPWGVRLHSEVVAVVRKFHWFELGFSEDFLFTLFARAGFVGERVRCEPSLFGRLYVFRRRPAEIHVAEMWMPPALAAQWHAPQAAGRWTHRRATLPLDARSSYSAVEVDLVNLHRYRLHLRVDCGPRHEQLELAPGQRATVRFDAPAGLPTDSCLQFQCLPSAGPILARALGRAAFHKGVFVRRLRYVPLPAQA